MKQIYFKVIIRKKIHFDMTLNEIRDHPMNYIEHHEFSNVIIGFTIKENSKTDLEKFKEFAKKKLKKQYRAYQIEEIIPNQMQKA